MIAQQSNWITRARKAAGSKGPAQVDVLDDINQMLLVANLDAPEYDFLGGVKQMVISINVAGVAAQFSTVSLFNPAGSNLLCVVSRIQFVTPTANAEVVEFVRFADTALGLFSPVPSDFRWNPGNPQNSAMIVRTGTLAGVLGDPTLSHVDVLATQGSEFERAWIIPPGFGMAWQNITANSALRGAIWYKERTAESGELGIGG